MTAKSVHVFDPMLGEANLWLKRLAEILGSDDPHHAYVALRAVLHALRDRIGPAHTAQLGAQLPMLVRGLYFEGWRANAAPSHERHREAFLAHVAREFPRDADRDAEAAARAVFTLLSERIDTHAVAKLLRILPGELRALWPDPALR